MLRAFLLLNGLGYLALGLAYLVSPAAMGDLSHLVLPDAIALIDVQGFYGGQMAGIGVLLLLALRLRWLDVPALVTIVATLGGTATGRLAGFALTGSVPPVMVGLFVLEVAIAAIAAWLLVRARAPA